MTMFGRVLGVVVGCAAAGACAMAPERPPTVMRMSALPHGFDASWSAVLDLMAERGWTLGTVDRASGLVSTGWMPLEHPGHAECPDRGPWGSARRAYQVVVRVKPQDGAPNTTAVTVTATFRQIERVNGEEEVRACESRGTLERLFHTRLAALQPGAAGTASAEAR